MKLVNVFMILTTVVFLWTCQQPASDKPLKYSNKEIERSVSDLLSKMTLEEKVGQMTQITLDVLMQGEKPESSFEPLAFDTAMLRKAFVTYSIGSVLNTANNRARNPSEWNGIVKTIQDYIKDNSRLRIPVIYGLDMIHGASYVDGATFFPQQIGMAATWNPELVTRAGEITAYETRATGVAWTFSPVLDLGVDPRWPRQWETFGEDPMMASIMGAAIIKGYQGADNQLDDPYRIHACIKHYLGYSHTLSGKDRSPAWIPENKLREYHLPSFAAGVKAGSLTVMVNSGEINGLPVHISKYLLTDVLKNELEFEGFILTDWSDIEYLHTRHMVADNHKEAVKLAINAGIDMSMVPYNFNFADYLIELVKEGAVPMSRIDDAVTRILRVKFIMGLFATPYTVKENYPAFASEEFAADAMATAAESITLLKNNEGILPLPKNAKILVAGPAANSMRPLNGGWSYSWQGNLVDEFASGYNTIFGAITKKSETPANINLFEGVSFNHHADYTAEIVHDLTQFTQKASKADVLVLCIGENSYCEKPGDLEDLYLSDNQQELVKIAAKTGKPIVLVLVQGRPRVISKIEPMAKAIVNAYLPGNYGGDAIASILFGETNPSGKLPITYPRYPNSLEPYYIKHAEQLEIAGSPTGTQYNPQYHFGFGLSYSTFEYSNLNTDKEKYGPDEKIKVSIEVTNTSSIEGKEVVQIFSSDRFASLTPSVKRLRAFNKVNLKPGETQTINFEIPAAELAFVGLDNRWWLEKGEFIISCGKLSKSIHLTENKYFKSK